MPRSGTRDVKIRFDDQPIDGYVRMNGRTIGSVASGATERANADTQSLFEELWTYSNIVVPGGKGASGPADFTANKPLTLPDIAGRGIFGMDDMGAGARSNLTSATITNPTLVGSYGGSQLVTIAQTNLPAYTLTGGSSANFTVSGTSDFTPTDHTHHIDFTSGSMNRSNPHDHTATTDAIHWAGPGGTQPFGGSLGIPAGNVTVNARDIDHEHRVLGDTLGISANHRHAFTWTGVAPNISIGSGGGGAAITNLPPIMTFMIYIRL